jgi:hypothetical protein
MLVGACLITGALFVACGDDDEGGGNTGGTGGGDTGGTGGGDTGGTGGGDTGGSDTGGTGGGDTGGTGGGDTGGTGGGDGDGGTACAIQVGEPACDTCINTKCLAECNKCASNADCMAIWTCVMTTCIKDGGADVACAIGCVTSNTDGTADFMAFYRGASADSGCVSTKCADACPG